MEKQIQKQDQTKVEQITIDEVIAEVEATEAEEASTQKHDVCEGCQNHTCDWGACCMSKN